MNPSPNNNFISSLITGLFFIVIIVILSIYDQRQVHLKDEEIHKLKIVYDAKITMLQIGFIAEKSIIRNTLYKVYDSNVGTSNLRNLVRSTILATDYPLSKTDSLRIKIEREKLKEYNDLTTQELIKLGKIKQL